MIVIPLGFAVMELGMIVVTRKAAAHLDPHQANAALLRHMTGDWGEIDATDYAKNDEALDKHQRIVSSYIDCDFRRFMIVTEADRSATTILLPGEQ